MRLGKITENALKRSVLKPIRTEFKNETSAAVGTDCAFSNSRKTFMTVSPVTENVSDAGYYAVIKAVNGLACQGIIPDQVNLSIFLPEDAEEPELKKIIKDAIEAAKKCNVAYTGGHTEVTSAVNRAVVTATCTGYCDTEGGKEALFEKRPKAGQELVITKWAALEGTAMLAKEKFEELTGKYPVPFIDDARSFREYLDIRKDIEVALRAGISGAHDLSNGGVFAGLWEMAQKAGCGLKVDLKKIPMRQETIEICEFFEINPYQLLSGGALLLSTDNGEKLVTELLENGIPAAIVGALESSNDKIIANLDETRFLELPQADEIHKIL